jgi:hypothetical protein
MSIIILIGALAREEHIQALSSLLSDVPEDEASNISVRKNLKLNMIFEVRNYDRVYRGAAAVEFLSNWAMLGKGRELNERLRNGHREIEYDRADERFTRIIQAPAADADPFGPSSDPASVHFASHGYLQDLPEPPPSRGRASGDGGEIDDYDAGPAGGDMWRDRPDGWASGPQRVRRGVRSIIGEKSRQCMGEPRELGGECTRICPQYGQYLSPRMRIGVIGVSP